MKNQFKNPLSAANKSAAQNQEWLTGGAQPVASNDQSQGHPASVSQEIAYSGGTSLAPAQSSLQVSRPRETPYPLSIEEQPTIKRPAIADDALALSLSATTSSAQKWPDSQVPGPGVASLPPGLPNNAPVISPISLNPQVLAPVQQASSPPPGPLAFATSANPFNQGGPAGPVLSAASLGAAPPAGPINPAFRPSRSAELLNPAGPSRGRGNDLPPPSNGSGGRKRKKRKKVPIWSRVVISVLLFFLIVGGTIFTYYELNFAGAINNIVGQQVPRYQGEGNPNASLNGNILSGQRINILLLGSDTDQKFSGNYLAQTDIVVTIDPATKAVGMLSIPRDFYVNVPGYGLHKLDEAYNLGGVALSRLTIEQDFGITINYFAWVGLDGFIKVINTLGGVDVSVTHPIVDDNYPNDINSGNPYAVERLYIPPGPQHLDGTDALDYVRSRHADLVGDFGRSARQQQVLTALKSKLDNPDIFSKLSTIANELNGSVKTDMGLSDVLKLMTFAKDLNINTIQKLILEPPMYSQTGTAPADTGPDSGASVVFPNCSTIDTAIQSMFQLSNSQPCQNVASTEDVSKIPAASPVPLAVSVSNSVGTQNVGEMLGNSEAGLTDGPSDLFGVRSLLDLMMLVVFESPDALQV